MSWVYFRAKTPLCDQMGYRLLTLLRHADRIDECLSSRAKRKTYARTEFF